MNEEDCYSEMDEKDYYIEHLTGLIEVLESARKESVEEQTDAAASVKRISHNLKGSGSTYGFPDISNAAAMLEESAMDMFAERLDHLIGVLKDTTAVAKAVMTLQFGQDNTCSLPESEMALLRSERPSKLQKTILLVDDDPDMLLIASLSLEKYGDFRVMNATGGKDAMAIARRERPDAMIIDFMMPDIDGQKLVEMLDADELTKGMPVIFLTAKSKESDKQHLSSLGVKGVITKPFDPEEFSGEVHRLLQ